jgi:hypothetical protein
MRKGMPKMARMPRMKSPARQAAAKNMHASRGVQSAARAAERKATKMRK